MKDHYFDRVEVVYAVAIHVQGRDASSFVLSKQRFLNEVVDPCFNPGEVVYAGTIPVQSRDASSFVLSKQRFLSAAKDLISLLP
jgi:hypothetical protein